jgi:hypothetical protein
VTSLRLPSRGPACSSGILEVNGLPQLLREPLIRLLVAWMGQRKADGFSRIAASHADLAPPFYPRQQYLYHT